MFSRLAQLTLLVMVAIDLRVSATFIVVCYY